MTIQTKHFIDPSDIVSIRFDCKHCKTSVSIAISSTVKIDTLAMCPSCRKPWLAIPDGPSLLPDVVSFAKAVNDMVSALRDWRKGTAARNLEGFSMELEINIPLPPVKVQ